MSEAVKTAIIIIIEITIWATVFTLAVIFFVLWIAKKLKEPENTCAYGCGLSCKDDSDFCSEAHANLFHDEEDLARNEEIADAEEEDALREIKELGREERKSKVH